MVWNNLDEKIKYENLISKKYKTIFKKHLQTKQIEDYRAASVLLLSNVFVIPAYRFNKIIPEHKIQNTRYLSIYTCFKNFDSVIRFDKNNIPIHLSHYMVEEDYRVNSYLGLGLKEYREIVIK